MDEITIVKTIEVDGSSQGISSAALELEAAGFVRMPGLLSLDSIKLPLYRLHGDSEGYWFGDCKASVAS